MELVEEIESNVVEYILVNVVKSVQIKQEEKRKQEKKGGVLGVDESIYSLSLLLG